MASEMASTTLTSVADLNGNSTDIPFCMGCKLPLVESSDTVVVSFGNSLWHVDCFRCAKCQNPVKHDTNLLILTDGSPVCENCSYICSVCDLPINNEAIVTGDESYHADCFRCKSCQKKIEELVFAKTARGIYCMTCHNERVARSRKAEAKRTRSIKGRDRDKATSKARTPTSANIPDTPRSHVVTPNGTTEAFTLHTAGDTAPAVPDRTERDPNLTPQRPRAPPHHDGRSLPMSRSPDGSPHSPDTSNLSSSTTTQHSHLGTGTGAQTLAPTGLKELRQQHRPQRQHYHQQQQQQQPHSGSSRDHHPLSHSYSQSPTHSHPGSVHRKSIDEDQASLISKSSRSDIAHHQAHSLADTDINSISHARQLSLDRTSNDGNGRGTPTSSSADGLEGGRYERVRKESLGTTAAINKAANRISGFYGVMSLGPSPSEEEEGPRERSLSDSTTSASVQDDPPEEATLIPSASRSIAPSLQIQTSAPAPTASAPAATSSAPGTTAIHNSVSFYDPDILVFLDALNNNQDTAFNAPQGLTSPVTPRGPEGSQGSLASAEHHSNEPSPISPPRPDEDDDGSQRDEDIERLSETPREEAMSHPEDFPTRRQSSDDDGLVRAARESINQSRTSNEGLNFQLMETLVNELESTKEQMKDLQRRYNEFRRASRTAFEGFSLAREEYDKEVAARREMETIMVRLRQRLADQATQLTALDRVKRDSDAIQRRSRELQSTVDGMEQHLSQLRIERDLTVAEVEELAALSGTRTENDALSEDALRQSFSERLEAIKDVHRKEIESLVSERDSLTREVEELKQTRDIFAEETAVLNLKNSELSEQNAEAARQLDAARETLGNINPQGPNQTQQAAATTVSPVPTPLSAPSEFTAEVPSHQVRKGKEVEIHAKKKKGWLGGNRGADVRHHNGSISKLNLSNPARGNVSERQHVWQQVSILRPVRCEFCGDKMWGLQECRCAGCGSYCHSKCTVGFTSACATLSAPTPEQEPPPSDGPPIFGNDLIAQAQAEGRSIPTIVTACITAVESMGMQYEGIYRKTGGMAQTKMITQCFERGEPFDLEDSERFNDIAAVTSCLKNYFRALPNPLFTFEQYDNFVAIAGIQDADARLDVLDKALQQLPEPHLYTIRFLMNHLHRVHIQSAVNRMTSSNLGVVFGPTLLKSGLASREFSDMGPKAKIIEVLVENAPHLTQNSPNL